MEKQGSKSPGILKTETPSSPTSKRESQPSSPQGQYVGNSLKVNPTNIRHSSIAGEGVGITDGNQPRKKKQLDPSDPSTWTRPHTNASNEHRPRATSEIQRATFNTKEEGDSTGSQSSPVQLKSHAPPSIDATEQTNTNASGISRPTAGEVENPHGELSSSVLTAKTPDSPESQKALPPSSPQNLTVRDSDDDANRRFSNQSASFSTMTDDSDRLGTIVKDEDRNNEDAVEESSSESERSSSDGESGSPVAERGRKRKSDNARSPPVDDKESGPITPQITVDDTSDPKESKPHPPEHPGALSETKSDKIHPRSNYNRGRSPAALSAVGNDDEELQRAKALELRVSPLDETIPGRTVKMLIRGDWNAFQNYEDEEQEYRHEPRLYMVCTDLSNEATYALEWTVGTLLKDGDTILVINAIEDETATGAQQFEEPSMEIKLESAKAAEDATQTMDTLTKQTTNQEGDAKYEEKKKLKVAALKEQARSLSRTGKAWSKKDEHRVKAIDKLESDLLKFVRKTTLQVRCMFEVIHCRSSRHLILNAIDTLEPTLVVVGTRGLGVVKNVVMGSFSNYLVQKSSIPVMVARKRLKKAHHAKISSQQIRMTNNLTSFSLGGKRKSLTQARID